jgi:phospholipid transport system substrate-binding protein
MGKLMVSRMTKRVLQTRVAVISLLGLLLYVFLPSPSTAGSPTEQMRMTLDKVLTIVRNSNLSSEAKREDLRARLVQVIYPRFDFSEMAKRSLGPHWRRRTAEQQREFVEVFAGLLGRTYAERIESYSTQTILYTREVEDQNYAQVDTKVVTDKREELSVNYKLHSVNKEWKVYDVVIEDISLVNNYRSQFDRVIARSSFEELVRMMKEKES